MTSYLTPDQVYKDLFYAVQESGIFPDSKTFVDAIPTQSPESILKAYYEAKDSHTFDLKSFVDLYFKAPSSDAIDFKTDKTKTAIEHAASLWPILKRQADQVVAGSSLISLKHPYIVPGGRFGEIYYWDSYFTMLGLRVSGEVEMIRNMINNFADIITRVGYIPNGNRTYFIGRSQPPFFSSMVALLADIDGPQVYIQYLDAMLTEYTFWMKSTTDEHITRAITLPDGSTLSRYSDNNATPRMESHIEDVELAHHLDKNQKGQLYRHLRGACESGWDFSTRWIIEGDTLDQIATCDIIPIDLNCLLYHMESSIALAYEQSSDHKSMDIWLQKASSRKAAIQKWLWDETDGIYKDYNHQSDKHTAVPSLAMMYPLFYKIADPAQAAQVAEYVNKKFVKSGGVVTTLNHSGQQWDAPNGWAPLQWITVVGLRNYDHSATAKKISDRWLTLNEQVYAATGKFVEKYNVEDLSLEAGGGEYPVQDGFGWTNGVYLALKNTMKL